MATRCVTRIRASRFGRKRRCSKSTWQMRNGAQLTRCWWHRTDRERGLDDEFEMRRIELIIEGSKR